MNNEDLKTLLLKYAINEKNIEMKKMENKKTQNKLYNPDTAVEIESKGPFPEDSIFVGVITDIQEGIVKDFISEKAQQHWKSDLDGNVIEVSYEVIVPETKATIKHSQLFTFELTDEGRTGFTTNSNLAKYYRKYGNLPEVGQTVKVMTDSNGRGKIKLD